MRTRRRLPHLSWRDVGAAVSQTVALAIVAAGVVVGVTAAPAAAYPAKPLTDWSFYITSSNTTTAYNLGCNQGNFDRDHGNINSEVTLAFGAQKSDLSGNYLPGTATYISKANVEAVAENFARGYYVCTGSDLTSTMYLDLGTNNDGSNVSNTAGQAWGNVINDVKNYVNANLGQVVIQGANDIEPSWSSYSSALAWAQGYDSATAQLYLNFGSADGCPQTTHSNGSCNNGWNQYDVWYISWGIPPAITAPEIYFSAQAKQWAQISQYGYYSQGGRAIHFIAPWDEYDLDTSTFTSQQAWDNLLTQLYSNSNTAYAPSYSMQIHRE